MKSSIERLLEKLGLNFSPKDIERIQNNIDILKKHNLSKLSDRVLSLNKSRKFLEGLTELNFTAQLLRSLSSVTEFKIEYEPSNQKRPVDLIVELSQKKYFIQLKSLSPSIRDNKQSQLMREIRRISKNIQCQRGIFVNITEKFTTKNIEDMMSFVRNNLKCKDGEKLIYKKDEDIYAEIVFKTPIKSSKNHLVLYSFGDVNMVNVTGMSKDQIKNSLRKAVGAFENNSSDNNINLIISEISNDQQDAMHFAEALYGTEYFTFGSDHKMHSHRYDDGLYLENDFAMNVAGVIILHKKEFSLTSDYEKVICSNPSHNYLIAIFELIHDRVIERYTWINGGFFHD